ncbi:aminoglycoside phosphotransferase [Paenibacillus sambharensis]|uniref:Aminoglycoside phosphotransferase n=1 Tax=Paenibacillus sambharensis TaxID=1803190 RepID=A0A2W1M017_9BACL|nr:phosphotransferase [Paenibacillus sambharensis]PZD97077.1 aminoglycoside phosphotransferase [Paenibacillus sambharensis]
MIREIKEQFTEEILTEAIKRYDINNDSIRSLGGYESFVYEYQKNNVFYILKISHTIRRSINNIRGEIEFLNFLSNKGLAVSNAVPSTRGNMVEEIAADNGSFLAISYEMALGNEVSGDDWNESLYEKWGEFLGKIHHATKGYEGSNPALKRQAWDQEVQLKAEKYLRPDDAMIPILKERLAKLTSLPKSKDTYGLTHTDFHQSNFYLHNGHIYLFDFDDCSYTYFIHDIGITLCYALFCPFKEFENKAEYYKLFFRHFMKGYLKENTIQEEEIEYLHDSIKLRYALMYVYFHQANDVSQLDEASMNWLQELQRVAASGDPMLPIDFVQEFKSIYTSIH